MRETTNVADRKPTYVDMLVIQHLLEKATEVRAGYIEEMAAAYLTHTNIPPDQVEFVQQWGESELRFFFRKRQDEHE